MQFWQTLLKNPSGRKSMDNFAIAIEKIPKLVFSNTLENTAWDTAQLSDKSLEKKVLELKQSSDGRDFLIGCRSLIIQLMILKLIDEFQLCIHPVVAGSGLPLFEKINEMTLIKLKKTKIFGSGAVTLYYEPIN